MPKMLGGGYITLQAKKYHGHFKANITHHSVTVHVFFVLNRFLNQFVKPSGIVIAVLCGSVCIG